MKRYTISSAIRKKQMKTPMRYHYTSIIIAKIKNNGNARRNQISHTLLVGMQNDTDILENSMAVSYRINHTWPSTKLRNHPLSIYSREMKSHPYKNLYLNVHRSFIYNSLKLATTIIPLDK